MNWKFWNWLKKEPPQPDQLSFDEFVHGARINKERIALGKRPIQKDEYRKAVKLHSELPKSQGLYSDLDHFLIHWPSIYVQSADFRRQIDAPPATAPLASHHMDPAPEPFYGFSVPSESQGVAPASSFQHSSPSYDSGSSYSGSDSSSSSSDGGQSSGGGGGGD